MSEGNNDYAFLYKWVLSDPVSL